MISLTADGERRVADGLIRLSVLAQSAFTRTAERHGLPAAQARLLCVLAGGARGMSELAGLLGIEKAALTGLADRAERRGLVARTAVPGDRRAVSVALTPAGRDAAGSFHRDLSAEMARLAEVLPPGERERFCRSLARVTASAPWPAGLSLDRDAGPHLGGGGRVDGQGGVPLGHPDQARLDQAAVTAKGGQLRGGRGGSRARSGQHHPGQGDTAGVMAAAETYLLVSRMLGWDLDAPAGRARGGLVMDGG